ncbi:MAG: hypothetical protein ACRDG4_20340, partial [Chloroflexota bacterium]
MKRAGGAAVLILIILAMAFFGFTGRGRQLAHRIVNELHQAGHELRHPGSAADLTAPPADSLLVGPPAGARPLRTHPTSIYQAGALAAGWQDWSWASHVLKAQVKGADKGAIAVHYAAWTGLYFHAAQPLNAWAGTVDLTLNGGPTGGQQLTLTLMDGNG